MGQNWKDTRLSVTIARKGYEFAPTVSLAEAGDTPRQAPVQVPTTESLRADARPVHEVPIKELVPKAPVPGRLNAIVSKALEKGRAQRNWLAIVAALWSLSTAC